MPNIAEKTLKDFIEEKLSVREFEALPDTLEITQNKLTMILKNPLIMDMSELFAMAKVLGITWRKLIEEFIEPIQ